MVERFLVDIIMLLSHLPVFYVALIATCFLATLLIGYPVGFILDRLEARR